MELWKTTGRLHTTGVIPLPGLLVYKKKNVFYPSLIRIMVHYAAMGLTTLQVFFSKISCECNHEVKFKPVALEVVFCGPQSQMNDL